MLGPVYSAAKIVSDQLEQPFKSAMGSSSTIGALAFILTLRGLQTSYLRSFEGRVYDWAFSLAISGLSTVLFVTCWHFYRCWKLLRIILVQLETHQIRGDFSALPADHSWSPIWETSPRKRSYLLLTRAIDCLNALIAQAGQRSWPAIPAEADKAKERVSVILKNVAKGQRENAADHANAQESLAKVTNRLITNLQAHWNLGSSEIEENAINRPRTEKVARTTGYEFEAARPIAYQAEFVALRYLAFIRYVMLQLRNLLSFISAGFMALAFSLMCYPFQGEHLIGWDLTVIFCVIAVIVIIVFTQMETDATLSRITDTNAGKLGFDFFHRVLSYGTLPVLTVLASHFNGVGQLLFSWIQPALKGLH